METDEQLQPKDHLSQYPDPEQSGISLPWLDRYQPGAAENISTGLHPMPQASVRYPTQSRAVLEDSDNDSDCGQSDVEAGSVKNSSNTIVDRH